MNWYRKSRCVLAKDAPLNLRGWFQRWRRFYKWADSVLSSMEEDDARTATAEFARIVAKASNEDRYFLSQTEYGYMWEDDPQWFLDNVRRYADTLQSTDFYIGDQQAKKALGTMQYIDDHLKRIEYYHTAFQQARKAVYEMLREYAGEEGSSLSAADFNTFIESARRLSKWFNDFSNIERARKSVSADLETLLDWRGSEGPADRSSIDKLYHATVSAPRIESEGFRVDTDVKGLGGATDDMISTTLSKKVAMAIADSLKRIIMLANGSADVGTVLKWARKAGVWDLMEEWGEGGMSGVAMFMKISKELGEDKVLDMLEKGYAPVFPYGMDERKMENLPEGAVPIATSRVGNQEWVDSYWLKDQKRHDDLVLGMFRTYLAAMQQSGKGYDPLFFAVDLDNFRGMDTADVGVFGLEADMDDPEIKYVEGMYEYRIPIDSIESVERIA